MMSQSDVTQTRVYHMLHLIWNKTSKKNTFILEGIEQDPFFRSKYSVLLYLSGKLIVGKQTSFEYSNQLWNNGKEEG